MLKFIFFASANTLSRRKKSLKTPHVSPETLNASLNVENRQFEKGIVPILEKKKATYLERFFSILRILQFSAKDHSSSQLLVPNISSEKLCAITLQLEIETFKVTQNPELLGNGNSTR